MQPDKYRTFESETIFWLGLGGKLPLVAACAIRLVKNSRI